MLKWQYERGNFSFPSQWQSVLIGTQQKLSQSLEPTPHSRCYAPLLPGQCWTCWATQHPSTHHCPCPACGYQLWAHLQGEMETPAFMELYHFQTGICHKFIDALIELSEAKERHVHSTPPLFKVGTPEFRPNPWNKLPYSLLLDMRYPVQSCCAPETLSGPMICLCTFQSHALVHSWFRKCFFGDSTQLKQTITGFSRSLSETYLHYIPQGIMQHRWR